MLNQHLTTCFRSCTNPHSFDADNIRFLGTYGQNIDDHDKYSEAESKLDFVERTLRWRHLASYCTYYTRLDEPKESGMSYS
ncbi:hypothetical protein DY000_02028512 [Brassica cretica]|uniref:DNA polymerase alpha/delta/epsilon subunit B domain-containing protein n=1 Tax=Brassica cretica TaxID=69181 RepID=A0ABQ7DHW2_BRACR|nr:hypothetical protein DY000_02028512 [Brassica cretica]